VPKEPDGLGPYVGAGHLVGGVAGEARRQQALGAAGDQVAHGAGLPRGGTRKRRPAAADDARHSLSRICRRLSSEWPSTSSGRQGSRNLLVHNGPATGAILSHARGLLRPGGHLLCAEPDITGLRFPGRAAAEQELEQRWIQMMRSMGNDPGLGAEGQLAGLISAAGFIPDSVVHRVDPLDVERSPAWTARQMMVDKGFATNADIARWDTAIAARLRDVGLLACRLPVTAVVAHPQPTRRPPRCWAEAASRDAHVRRVVEASARAALSEPGLRAPAGCRRCRIPYLSCEGSSEAFDPGRLLA
jgi:hypothetical protein